ncbi:MFS transporter [Marinobacterium aestuariivivens]|uniref:MFS transporter n=1 Tax=Marinobacterium aestuariivivens TaxID=1698799 RepID=A0ABW2A206_9GAMM
MSHRDSTLPYWRLSAFYFFWACVIGALMPYWGLYLQQLGYDERAIGSLMAILMGTQVAAPYLWGYLADRSGRRMGLVRLGVWLSLFCFAGVFFVEGFAALALTLLGFGFFWNAMAPQFEAVTLSYLGEQPGRYSHIRLWGSIGFILTVIALGRLLDIAGPGLLPGFIAAMLLLVIAASYAIGDHRVATGVPISGGFLAVLKQPPVLIFFLTCFLMQASHGPYNTFFSIYLARHDYSATAIGLLWSLGTAVEVGVFLLMHRWLNRYSLRSILLLSLLLAALRWGLIGAFPEQLAVILFAQCLHGATFGSFHAAAIESVRRHFPGALAGQGQAFYSSASIGLGNAVGAFYSGLSWQGLGAFQTFGIAALVALGGAWLYWRCDERVAQPIGEAY